MSGQYLLIGADIVPTRENVKIFEGGCAEELIGSQLFKILSESFFIIFNLEVPLTDTRTPIQKMVQV